MDASYYYRDRSYSLKDLMQLPIDYAAKQRAIKPTLVQLSFGSIRANFKKIIEVLKAVEDYGMVMVLKDMMSDPSWLPNLNKGLLFYILTGLRARMVSYMFANRNVEDYNDDQIYKALLVLKEKKHTEAMANIERLFSYARTARESAFLQCIDKNVPDEQLSEIFNLALTGYLPEEAFEVLLKHLKDRINPSTFKVRLPMVQYAMHLPTEGTTCTLLSALCLKCDYDMTPCLCMFLETYTESIAIPEADFAQTVLDMSQFQAQCMQQNAVNHLHAVCSHFRGRQQQFNDLTLVNKPGSTALHYACEFSDFNGFLSLVGAYINPNVQNKDGETVAMKLARNSVLPNNFSNFHEFYGTKLDINKQDPKGNTCLMIAVRNRPPDDIKLLLAYPNMDLTVRNWYDQDVMDIVNAHPEIDPKIQKMVQVAYKRQTEPPEEERTLVHYFKKIQQVIKSSRIDPQTSQQLTQRVDLLAEDIKHALQGHTMPSVGMMPEHRLKIQGNRVELMFELDTRDEFMDHLLQDGIIDHEKLVEFRDYQTRRERITRFLDHLPYCGEKAYASFIAALRATMKGYLADKLGAYDPNSVPAASGSANMALVASKTSNDASATDAKVEFHQAFLKCMQAFGETLK